MEIDTEPKAMRRMIPGSLRAHAFLGVALAGVLVGAGLRFVPTSTAALPGSSGGGAASTACAAK